MKILVTGGAGYIGSHTVTELIQEGFQPIIVDNLCNSSVKNLEGIRSVTDTIVQLYNVDCTNEIEFKEVFEKEKDIVGAIHFAAYKSVEESVREPEKYFQNNIGSLKVLLKLMEHFEVDYLIFSSSCTVYGTPDNLPVTEEAPFKKAESPYGETKQQCEEILQSVAIKSISLRYFNPIGSHSSGLIGDCSADKPANLIPIICEVAKGVREKLIVNGNDYNTIDGSCVRDYIHVVDLAKSHVAALKYLIKNPKKGVFNIGTGKGLSVLEAIQCFEKANKTNVNYEIGPRRDGDVEEIFSDNTKVEKLLDWKAQISLEQAMQDAWNWEIKK
ncbi:MAG: UDP-glucose 4-epimerase GalE [Flavobacteriales bacterium TMED123]|nr:MAG: UDP-glucose 4-epimerase GalE [Flavobacteriales bacterium TMED123]